MFKKQRSRIKILTLINSTEDSEAHSWYLKKNKNTNKSGKRFWYNATVSS